MWFGHMETKKEDRLVKRTVGSDVRGVMLRGSPRTGWMNSVNERGMPVEQGRMIVRDRCEWRAVMNA